MNHNKWDELDEHPIVGKFHIRHTILGAEDTGYMFGKNFDTLDEALAFAKTKYFSVGPRPRLLIHVKDTEWLLIHDLNGRYGVFASVEEFNND